MFLVGTVPFKHKQVPGVVEEALRDDAGKVAVTKQTIENTQVVGSGVLAIVNIRREATFRIRSRRSRTSTVHK